MVCGAGRVSAEATITVLQTVDLNHRNLCLTILEVKKVRGEDIDSFGFFLSPFSLACRWQLHNLHDSLKTLSPKTDFEILGIRALTYEFWGIQFSP